MKDGLGVRIYNVWKCELYESRPSVSQEPPVLIRECNLPMSFYEKYQTEFC